MPRSPDRPYGVRAVRVHTGPSGDGGGSAALGSTGVQAAKVRRPQPVTHNTSKNPPVQALLGEHINLCVCVCFDGMTAADLITTYCTFNSARAHRFSTYCDGTPSSSGSATELQHRQHSVQLQSSFHVVDTDVLRTTAEQALASEYTDFPQTATSIDESLSHSNQCSLMITQSHISTSW